MRQLLIAPLLVIVVALGGCGGDRPVSGDGDLPVPVFLDGRGSVLPAGSLVVHHVPSGRGHAVLIEGDTGTAVLVDGGAPMGGPAIVDYLSSIGMSEIDVLVASGDPTGAVLCALLDAVTVNRIIIPGGAAAPVLELRSEPPVADGFEGQVVRVAENAQLRVHGHGLDLGSLNGSPVAARLDFSGISLLFSGHRSVVASGGSISGGSLWDGPREIPSFLCAVSSAHTIVGLGPTGVEGLSDHATRTFRLDGVRGYMVVGTIGGRTYAVVPPGGKAEPDAGVPDAIPEGRTWTIARHPGVNETAVSAAGDGGAVLSSPALVSHPDKPHHPRLIGLTVSAALLPGGDGVGSTPARLESVTAVQDGTRMTVTVATSPQARGTVSFDESTGTLVIDLPHTKAGGMMYTDLTTGPMMQSLSVEQVPMPVFPGLQTPGTRVALGLSHHVWHTVTHSAGRLVVEVEGSPLHGKVIVIDPGHGGIDLGAVGRSWNTFEKNITLSVSLKLEKLLVQAGAVVRLTRRGDTNPSSQARVELANRVGADLLMSIHFNGHTDRSIRGVETFYCGNHPGSRPLANIVHRHLVDMLSLPDRRVRLQRFAILRDATMPAVLVEPTYITHADHELLLRDPLFQDRIAEALLGGLLEFFGR